MRVGMNERRLLASVVLLTVIVLAACTSSGSAGSPSAEPSGISEAAVTGQQLVDRFLGMLKGPDTDTEALSEILAPNFQLVRADDTRETKESYLANPAQVNEYSLANLNAVVANLGTAPTLTVSFDISIDEVINDEHIKTTAPRLGTFQWDGQDWVLVSWANFNPVA